LARESGCAASMVERLPSEGSEGNIVDMRDLLRQRLGGCTKGVPAVVGIVP
jgi:hypothetical protein